MLRHWGLQGFYLILETLRSSSAKIDEQPTTLLRIIAFVVFRILIRSSTLTNRHLGEHRALTLQHIQALAPIRDWFAKMPESKACGTRRAL